MQTRISADTHKAVSAAILDRENHAIALCWCNRSGSKPNVTQPFQIGRHQDYRCCHAHLVYEHKADGKAPPECMRHSAIYIAILIHLQKQYPQYG